MLVTSFIQMNVRTAVCTVIHDDSSYSHFVLRAVPDPMPMYVIASKLPWSGEPGEWMTSVQIAEENGAEVVIGSWATVQNWHAKP